MTSTTSDRLLRGALTGNATFSLVCGTALLIGADGLGPWFGIPALALRAVGVALLPFAVALWVNARRDRLARGEAWGAVALDAAWVLGSIALLVGGWVDLRPPGFWAVVGVAEVVALWATLQTVGLVRSRPTAAVL